MELWWALSRIIFAVVSICPECTVNFAWKLTRNPQGIGKASFFLSSGIITLSPKSIASSSSGARLPLTFSSTFLQEQINYRTDTAPQGEPDGLRKLLRALKCGFLKNNLINYAPLISWTFPVIQIRRREHTIHYGTIYFL